MRTKRPEGPQIEELSGSRHRSLQAAQEAAMPILAQLVANIVHAGLDSGRYIVENGIIKLSEEVRSGEQLPARERRPRLGVLP
jgi:hypothetical protein